jgi:hypothetical protein
MTPNQQMEQFSLAHIRAVAAQAGYQVTRPETDTGIDGTLMDDAGRRSRIDFQAKSTADDIQRDRHLHFPLPVRNYDILRDPTPSAMRILIVVLMPRDNGQWLHQTEDELCLRHCAYWLLLEEHPPVPNTTSVTVQIPVTNVFNSEQLHSLMESV